MSGSCNRAPEMTKQSLGAPPRTTAALSKKLADSHDPAWNWFVQTYGPQIYAYARKSGASAEDSADVMQQTFIGVARGVSKFEYQGAGSFSAFVFAIARFRLADLWRNSARTPRGIGGSDNAVSIQTIPDRSVTSDPAVLPLPTQTIQQALDCLNSQFESRTIQIALAVIMHERPAKDIASEFNCAASTVRVAVFRVRQALNSFLNPPPEALRHGPDSR